MTEPDCPPGRRLLRFAERVFDPETVERVLRPAVADLQHECENRDERANAAGGVRSRSRLAIRVRAYWGLWKTLAICFAGEAMRVRGGLALSLGTRTLLFVVLLLVLVTAAQSTTWSYTFGSDHGAWAAITANLLLLPATLTVVLPVAFFLAVALFKTKGRMPALIPSATAGAVACAAALFIGVMFVVPPINQSFRTYVFNTLQRPEPGVPPRVLSKGLAELTWTELNAQIGRPASSRQGELARAHRQLRFAFVGSAFVMALLGLGVAGRWRSRAATIGASLLLLALYGGCFVLASSLHRGGYPSALGTWSANIVFAVFGLGLLRSRKEWRDDATNVMAEPATGS